MRSAAPPPRIAKFGGGVLRGAADLERATADAAALVGDGAPLIVVVSAFHGRTDALLATARATGGPDAERDPATALLLAVGEIEAAARFALALRRRGLDVIALDPREAGVRVRGRRDGGVDGVVATASWRARLRPGAVVVVPGFVGVDAATGAWTTLGRGGSDLTAVLIARAVGAPVVELIKDVPGLFDADPHVVADAAPLPFATYAAARRLVDAGARVVQGAALDAAERAGIALVLRALGDPRRSVVAASPAAAFAACAPRAKEAV